MTDNPPISPPDEIDAQLLSLLEQYDDALRTGDTWIGTTTDEFTESQRLAWDAATLSLRTLADDRPRGKAREATAYLPMRIGRFEIDRMIGAGGFAVVYLGRDPFTGRSAAIKIPRPHVLLSSELRERFVREAQAAAKLDHPHIVPIYEAGIDGELPYIAYAYCDGPTLGAWLKQTPEPLPVRHAAELVQTLAEAVQYSHQCGILHRDITPGNVLLVPLTPAPADGFSFVPKLSDFGLAKLIESDFEETASSVFMGTPAYMAPEQAQRGNKSSGVMVDVYGLGAILYHALTGRAPLERETPWATLAALRESEPAAPHLLRPGLPQDLETVCLKCLERDPDCRYASAGHLAEDLGRFLTGRPVQARPASWQRQAWQWCRRHPAVAGLTAAVASTLMLLVCFLAFYAAHVQGLNQSLSDQKQSLTETVAQLDTALTEKSESQQLAERRALELQQTLYSIEVSRAAAAWKRGDVRVMSAALAPFRKIEAGEPDFREFGWRYLWKQQSIQEVFRERTPGPQYTARFSADGSQVAFAGLDSVVRIVSTVNRRVVQEIPTGQIEINGVIFGPQGDWLATAGDDGTVAIWNLPDGDRRAVWPVFENVPAYQLAYCEAEGLLVVCGQSPEVQLLDIATGERKGTLSEEAALVVESLALSPDGRSLLTCRRDRCAVIWDLTARQPRHRLDGFEQSVTSGAWSADSHRVAAGSLDGRVILWDAETGRQLTEERLKDSVQSVNITPDGWILAGDRAGLVTVFRDPVLPKAPGETDVVAARWALHQHRLYGMATSPDGKLLATASRDHEIGLFTPQIAPPAIRQTPVAASGVQSARPIAGPDGRGRLFRLSGDGIRVFEAGATEQQTLLAAGENFNDLNLQGDTLFAATEDGWLSRWNASGELRLLDTFQPFPSEGIRIAPLDQNRVLVQRQLEEVALWNYQLQGFERTWPRSNPMAVAPDRRRFALASGVGHGFILFDAATLNELWTATGHTEGILVLQFGPRGRRLYSGSGDRSILVWDLEQRQEILQFRGHESPVVTLALSADERTLASADNSGSVRLWDLQTGRELFELFRHDKEIRWLEFTADGAELVGIDGDLTEFRWTSRDAP